MHEYNFRIGYFLFVVLDGPSTHLDIHSWEHQFVSGAAANGIDCIQKVNINTIWTLYSFTVAIEFDSGLCIRINSGTQLIDV